MDLKDRIAEVISWTNYSPSEFADEVDVPRSSISHITSGRNKPSLDFLIKLKSRFPELQWSWLIEGKGEMAASAETHLEQPAKEKVERPPLPDLFSMINDESFGSESPAEKPVQEVRRESIISQPTVPSPALDDSQALATKEETREKAGTPGIRRIVIFYDNGRFESYEP